MMTTSNYFNILNKSEISLSIQENKMNLEMDKVVSLGARINPKRSFIFLSHLIGKHIEINPEIPKISGYLLANAFTNYYYKKNICKKNILTKAINTGYIDLRTKKEIKKTFEIEKSILFLGFAETATGLGHAVFSAFENAYYVHTTREKIINMKSVFDFQEEHSHAKEHLCYLLNADLLNNVDRIVLIDDEITTGSTCINLIKSIKDNFDINKFTILSILDWRNANQLNIFETFKRECNIELDVISLIKGEIDIIKDSKIVKQDKFKENDLTKEKVGLGIVKNYLDKGVYCKNIKGEDVSYLYDSGRFGISSSENKEVEFNCEKIANRLKKIRKSKKSLVVGTGEFIYLPSRIASYMGEGIKFKSTTRSPIYVSKEKYYPIWDRIRFYNDGVENFLYNLEGVYDEIFIIFESALSSELRESIEKELIKKGFKSIIFVVI